MCNIQGGGKVRTAAEVRRYEHEPPYVGGDQRDFRQRDCAESRGAISLVMF